MLAVVIGVPTAVGILLALVYHQRAEWEYQYPYGFSHCCDLQLCQALREYASTHGGAFPAGEATPEASLSLLYREKTDSGEQLVDANLLRGKTVPESVVKGILERGELLTPETCGWHYVEGLRLDDDPRLALFWDKAGLNHNGGRLPEGGHDVMFVSGSREYIPEAKWRHFLKQQRELLAQRNTSIHHDAIIQIDGRKLGVQIRVVDDCIYGSTWDSSELIGTTKEPWSSSQGRAFIPIEEIRDAKVVVEPAAVQPARSSPKQITVAADGLRVRFLLKGREIIYDRSGFRIEATPK
jgi:hypothetical protein